MSIETAIRTFLTTELANNASGIPDARITFGNANELAEFPALSYEIITIETQEIGQNPLRKASVEFVVSGNTALECITAYTEVEKILMNEDHHGETYDDMLFEAIVNTNSVFTSPSPSGGDEKEPYVATTTADIYYKED